MGKRTSCPDRGTECSQISPEGNLQLIYGLSLRTWRGPVGATCDNRGVTTDDDREVASAIHVYVTEIVRQADLFDFGVGVIESAVSSSSDDRRAVAVRLSAGITVCLAAAAFASKLLWPIGGGEWSQERGRALRDRLAVTQGSPLKSRSVRDSLEHFDERLDQFAREATNGFGAFHWMVMSAEHGLGESNVMPILRYIDPKSLVVRLPSRTPAEDGGRSVTVDLRVVRTELARVRDLASTLLA